MPQQISMAPVTIDVPGASRYLGVSAYLVRKLVSEGKLPHLRLGARILFRQAALDEYLHDLEVKSVRHEEAIMTRGIREVKA